jgi:predicted metalloendopeptidase
LGGLNVSLEAYKISLAGKEPPAIDGFTGLQRFFLGFAQVWRSLIREEALRNQIVSDPHSPAEFRANGTVRNMDEWYDAFAVQPPAKLYLPPEQRVRIW